MADIKLDTYLDIQNWILRRARQPITSTPEITRNEVKSAVQARYLQVSGKTKWVWRRKQRRLLLKGPIETGTVSITNGSREVTFSSATLDPTFLDRGFYVVGDNQQHRIVAVNVANSTVKLDERYQGTTSATASYLIYQNEYGLWPDFEELVHLRLVRNRRDPRIAGPDLILDLMNRFPQRRGSVRAVSLSGSKGFDNITMGQFLMGYDFMGGTTLLTKKMITWPHIPDQDHTMDVTYIQRLQQLEADTDRPLMPIEDRIVLAYGGLSDWYETAGDDTGASRLRQEYEVKLQQMLSDHQESDDLPQLVVLEDYRTDGADMQFPFGADYGQLFDSGP